MHGRKDIVFSGEGKSYLEHCGRRAAGGEG